MGSLQVLLQNPLQHRQRFLGHLTVRSMPGHFEAQLRMRQVGPQPRHQPQPQALPVHNKVEDCGQQEGFSLSEGCVENWRSLQLKQACPVRNTVLTRCVAKLRGYVVQTQLDTTPFHLQTQTIHLFNRHHGV